MQYIVWNHAELGQEMQYWVWNLEECRTGAEKYSRTGRMQNSGRKMQHSVWKHAELGQEMQHWVWNWKNAEQGQKNTVFFDNLEECRANATDHSIIWVELETKQHQPMRKLTKLPSDMLDVQHILTWQNSCLSTHSGERAIFQHIKSEYLFFTTQKWLFFNTSK